MSRYIIFKGTVKANLRQHVMPRNEGVESDMGGSKNYSPTFIIQFMPNFGRHCAG